MIQHCIFAHRRYGAVLHIKGYIFASRMLSLDISPQSDYNTNCRLYLLKGGAVPVKNEFRRITRYNQIFKFQEEVYRNMARRMGIPETKLWILYSLRCDGVVTQKDLCDWMQIPKQSVNSTLKKMEQEGILFLESMEENRKSKRILLTKKGQRLAKKTAEYLFDIEEQAFDCFDAKEEIQFLTLYERYVRRLKKITEACEEKQET